MAAGREAGPHESFMTGWRVAEGLERANAHRLAWLGGSGCCWCRSCPRVTFPGWEPHEPFLLRGTAPVFVLHEAGAVPGQGSGACVT